KMGYLPYLSTETWTLLVAAITLIVVYAYWPYGVFKRIGVPGPKPIPFLGTMLAYKRVRTEETKSNKINFHVINIYDGRQPLLCTTDVSLIKTVLIKECYSLFTNRRNLRVNGPLYDSVFNAEDDHWRRIRTVLSPTFTSGRLKGMFILMKQHSANLVRSITKRVDNNEDVLELKEFFGSYSMDVVASTSLSVDIDSLNNPSDPFVTNIRKMLKFDLFKPIFLLVAFFPILGPIIEKMEFSFFPSYVTDFFYASVQKIKANRESGRVDFLQYMMDSQKKGEESNGNEPMKGLTDHEVLSQAMIFIFAGYETSSSSLVFLAYNLALNPEVMTKLQQEIDSTFPNKGAVEYQALNQMEYLDSVINESLRLYPLALRLERVAKATVEINGLVIPKGTVVMVPLWVMHRDPDLWPNPEEFKPERFSKENKDTIDPYTYMPFGAGPRNCIGMRFALVMMKLAMVEILQKFSFAVCDQTEIPLELDVMGLLAPKRPLRLQLVPRSDH
uniref:Cytochrome P450 3A n=1 Tax=Gadus morhua TaxID=8049 RepID=A0A8C5B031_GADMO